jgi:uncharacterized protein with LGFP repeats
VRRLPTTLLSVGLLAPAVVLGPVLHASSPPAPHPVAPTVHTVSPAFAAGAPAAHVAGAVPTVTSAPQTGASFSTLGVSWPSSLPAADQVQVRTRDGVGAWSDWSTVGAEDAAPAPGSPDATSAARLGTDVTSEPLYTGPADTVQTRIVGASAAPTGVHVTLIDPGTSAADADPSGAVRSPNAASAAPAQPGIYTRAQWGADESLRSRNAGCGAPAYASTVKVAFVHHTDGTNDYTAAQVPAIIRGIYAYHVESNGWCDIGYNFLVDRFGRVWEGRYGGITRAVVGAQAGGFNTMSTGVALLGEFSSVTPPPAMVNALETLLAWKLSLTYADPTGMTSLVSGGGPDTGYPAGRLVPLHVISGHRDADQTTCPGQAAYNLLPSIRSAVESKLGLALTNPSVTSTQTGAGAPAGARFVAGLTIPSSWTATIRDANGAVVRTITGSGASIVGTWDGVETDGTVAPVGTYAITLQAGVARTYTASVTRLGYPDVLTVDPAGGGSTEVDVYSGDVRWATRSLQAASSLGAVDPTQWRFLVGPYQNDGRDDLFAISLAGTGSGHVEVHVLSEASGYRTFLAHYATPLSAVSGSQWQFTLGPHAGDRAQDLYAVRYAGAASGHVELHVLSAASSYHAFVDQRLTPLLATAPGAWQYLAGDAAGHGDLVAISLAGTGSGHAEAHIVSEASSYHDFTLHRALPISSGLLDAQYSLRDMNGDGIPDLVYALLDNTGSGGTEIHIVNGNGLRSYLLHSTTGIPALDPSVDTVVVGS